MFNAVLADGNTLKKCMSLVIASALVVISLVPYFANKRSHKLAKWTDILLIAAVGTFIYYYRSGMAQNYELNTDESDWIVNANTLLIDPRFMVSTVMAILITYPLLLIKAVGSNIDYYSIKIFGIFNWIICFILLYKSLKNIFKSGLELLVLLPFVAFIALLSYWDFVAYNSEYSPSLLFSLALYTYSLTYSDKTKKYAYPLLGFVLGCFLFSKIQMAPVAFIFALSIAAALLYEKQSKYLLVFCIAGFIPAIIVLGIVYLNGAIDVYLASIKVSMGYASSGLWNHKVPWPKKIAYFQQQITAIPELYIYVKCYALSAILIASTHIIKHDKIKMTYRFLYVAQAISAIIMLDYVLAIVIESILYIMFYAYFDKDREAGFRQNLYLVGFSLILMLATIYSILVPGTEFPHYFVLLIIPVCFLSSVIILSGIKLSEINGPTVSNHVRVVIILIAALFIKQFYSTYMTRRSNIYARVSDPYLNAGHAAIAAEISKYADKYERITVWGWSNKYYVMTQTALATRITFSFPQFLKGNADNYWLNYFLLDMITNKPVVFVEAITPGQFAYKFLKDYSIENVPQIKNFVAANYTLVSEIAGVRIYVANTRLRERMYRINSLKQQQKSAAVSGDFYQTQEV